MKKSFFLLFSILVLSSLLYTTSFSQRLEENFDYGAVSDTALITLTSNWVRHSGLMGPAYSSSSLSYTSYPSSGIGGSVTFTNGGSAINDGDINRTLVPSFITSNNIYASFLVNLSSALATKDYFFHLGPSPIGTTFRGRVFARSNSTGWSLSLSKSSEASTDDNTVLNFNQTYLVVLKYSYSPATASDDVVTLYLYDTGIPYAEPSSPIVTIGPLGSGTGSDPANIGAVAIRQGGNTPTGTIDGIRIDSLWSNIFPSAGVPTISVSPLFLSGFNYASGSGPSASQSYSLSGSDLSPASGNLTVTGSTNYEISKDNISFFSSDTVGYSGSTLASRTIYVRLKAGLTSGTYNGETVANSGGTATTQNVTCSGSVTSNTPTNHATSFAASLGTPNYSKVQLTWIDATGGTVPDGYLIKASTVGFASISNPIDGVPAVDSLLVRNVAQGVQSVSFTELSGDSTYYFKIFPYKGSGPTINYKIDGSVPQTNITMSSLPVGILYEHNFDYTGNVNYFGWNLHSGTGSPILTTAGLTYTGYPLSGIGNAGNVIGTGDDLNHGFTEQNIDGSKIYLTALANVTETADNVTGGYFMHLGDRTSPSSFSNFCARVWVKIDAGGNVVFGLSNGGTATYGTTNFSKNTTYLIIVKYTINVAGSDDVRMWVLSSGIPANEIAAGTPEVTITAENGQNVVDAVAIRQTTNLPDVIVDGIRVATNWLGNPASLNLGLTALMEGFYTSPTMIPDSVKVELRNASSPYALVDTGTSVLNSAGAGLYNFFSAVNGTPYYIVLKHRNSVETWSASGQSFTGGTMNYNFTTGSGQAYGSNMVMKGSSWCIYSGDVNQDGVVDLTDVATVDIDNLNFAFGYTVTDVNGDNLVDISDLSIVDTNNLNFVSKIAPSKLLLKRLKEPVQKPLEELK